MEETTLGILLIIIAIIVILIRKEFNRQQKEAVRRYREEIEKNKEANQNKSIKKANQNKSIKKQEAKDFAKKARWTYEHCKNVNNPRFNKLIPHEYKYIDGEMKTMYKTYKQLKIAEKRKLVNEYYLENVKWEQLLAKQSEDRKQAAIKSKKDAEEQEERRKKESKAGKLIELSIEPIYSNNNTQPGVYLIVNNKTRDFYIGESQNMNARRKTHIGDLTLGEHHSKLMQEHFNKYGKDAFEFYCLERFMPSEENVRKYAEKRWIKEYKPIYNV